MTNHVQLMANARRLNREDIYRSAFESYCQMAGEQESDPFKRAYLEALAAYELVLHEKHGKFQRAQRTRNAVKAKGIVAAIEAIILAKKSDDPQEGFKILVDLDLRPYTFEALVLTYPEKFSAEVVSMAHTRLHGE